MPLLRGARGSGWPQATLPTLFSRLAAGLGTLGPHAERIPSSARIPDPHRACLASQGFDAHTRTRQARQMVNANKFSLPPAV